MDEGGGKAIYHQSSYSPQAPPVPPSPPDQQPRTWFLFSIARLGTVVRNDGGARRVDEGGGSGRDWTPEVVDFRATVIPSMIEGVDDGFRGNSLGGIDEEVAVQ